MKLLLTFVFLTTCCVYLVTAGPASAGTCKEYKKSDPNIGESVPSSSYPSVVYIQIQLTADTEPSWNCAGFFLASQYILTAAHCVVPYSTGVAVSVSEITVYAGYTNSESPYEDLTVERILVHSDYDSTDEFHRYDLALIRLEEAVDTDEYPPVTIAYYSIISAGWTLYSVGYDTNDQLHYKKPVSTDGCAALYAADVLADYDVENTMCLAQCDNEFCAGDEGGPLYYGGSVVGMLLGSGEAECLRGKENIAINLYEFRISLAIWMAVTEAEIEGDDL